MQPDYEFCPDQYLKEVAGFERIGRLLKKVYVYCLKGAGGSRPKIIFNVTFVEGRQSYQMLFSGSKNIDPSRIYRIFKIAKYIQLPCGRALYSRLSQNLNFDTKNLSSPTVFELET